MTGFIPSPLAAMLAALLLAAGPTQAQTTYTVPNGVALTGPSVTPNSVPPAPADGSTITLQGNASITSSITLPTGGSPDLTINAVAGGSTVTLGGLASSPAFGNATANAAILDITGGAITFSGANGNTYGGVIRSSGAGALTISSASALTFSDNTLTSAVQINGNLDATGGAIFSNGATTLTAPTITLSNNTGPATGGALFSMGAVTINGNLVATDNSVFGTIGNTSGAGAIYSGSDITINGSLDAENNSGGSAGAYFAIGGAFDAIGNFTQTGNSVTLTGNTLVGSRCGAISAGDTAAGGNISLAATAGDVTITGNSTTSEPGGYSFGGVSCDGGSTAIQASGDITVTGNSAINQGYGGAFYSSGAVTLTAGGAITLSGNIGITNNGYRYHSSYGGAIYFDSTAGMATLTATTIDIENNKALNSVPGIGDGGAIYGSATLTGDTITLSGNQTMTNGGGIYGDTVTINGALTSGNNIVGGNGGAIWTNGNVTLNATNSPGITFSGNVQYNGSATPTVSGSGSSSTVSFSGGTAQANAIYLNNTPAATTTTLTLNAQGYPITFDDPIQNNPANGLITVTATGGNTVIFDGASQAGNAANQQSLIDGATEVTSGTTFAVRNNAVYGALAAEVTGGTASSFTVDNNAILAGGTTFANGTSAVHADTFTLAGTLNIAGNDAPGTATGTQASFSQFTVSSSATDTLTGGTVVFNTCLNNAATQLSDQLALDLNGGTTTGTATIQVNPVTAGCTGALTQGNGILLVNVSNGTTAADAFKLAAPVVAANGYTYSLKQASDGNWYLQSAAPLNDGINGGTVPTPIDARWMLALIGLLLASFGTRAMRRE